jgi:hypothetical protein
MVAKLPSNELADAPDLNRDRIWLRAEKLAGDVVKFLLAGVDGFNKNGVVVAHDQICDGAFNFPLQFFRTLAHTPELRHRTQGHACLLLRHSVGQGEEETLLGIATPVSPRRSKLQWTIGGCGSLIFGSTALAEKGESDPGGIPECGERITGGIAI